VTADTYTKYIHAEDLNVRTLFGDAAAATLIIADDGISDDLGPSIGPFVYGTDGRGARNLIVHNSGLRPAVCADEGEMSDSDRPCHFRLFMDGPEIFRFTIEAVPPMVIELLDRSNLALADVQLFVFHQANKFMLDHLRTKMKIPREKFYIAMRHCGNTVSASIPIALKHAWQEGRLQPGDRVVLVGFGVGYSWAAALVRWAI
jgi:3-oxoacyl-[acyl-carrier-protein] synthase-3